MAEEKSVTEDLKKSGMVATENVKNIFKKLGRRFGLKSTSDYAKGSKSVTFKDLEKEGIINVMESLNNYLKEEIEKKYDYVETTIYANLVKLYKGFGLHHSVKTAHQEHRFIEFGTIGRDSHNKPQLNTVEKFKIKIANKIYEIPVPPKRKVTIDYNEKQISYPVRAYGFKNPDDWKAIYSSIFHQIAHDIDHKAENEEDVYSGISNGGTPEGLARKEMIRLRLKELHTQFHNFFEKQLMESIEHIEHEVHDLIPKEKETADQIERWEGELDDNMLPWDRIVYKHTWRIVRSNNTSDVYSLPKRFLWLEVWHEIPPFLVHPEAETKRGVIYPAHPPARTVPKDPNTYFFYRNGESDGKDVDGNRLELDQHGLVTQDRDLYNLPMKEWRYIKGDDFKDYSVEIVNASDATTKSRLIPRVDASGNPMIHPDTHGPIEEFRRLDRGEKGYGLDKFGMPLEVGNGKGGLTQKGKILIDEYDFNLPDPDCRYIAGDDYTAFVGRVSTLDKAQQMVTMWDDLRDDFRDGRYHPQSLTIYEWIREFRKDRPSRLKKTLSRKGKDEIRKYTHRAGSAIAEHARTKDGMNLANGKILIGHPDDEGRRDVRRPSHLNPAFEWEAFLKEKNASPNDRPVWRHIGRKYYHQGANHIPAHEMKDPAISTRGIAMYAIFYIYQFEKYYDNMETIFDAFPNGFDFGPRTFKYKIPLNKKPFRVDTLEAINQKVAETFPEGMDDSK